MLGRLVPPGTIVGTTAPRGWTHLVIKSRPRIASGAIERLSKKDVQFATFLVMTTLARVGQRPAGSGVSYVLEEVACGVGTQVRGQDMVLSPDTESRLGADLGLIFRMILAGAYKEQLRVRVLARSATFLVQDTPALMHRNGIHVDVVLRYAFLVDPTSGRLDSLVWLIDRHERPTEVIGPLEWLAPNLLEAPPLHIDGNEFLLGQPTARTFATERIPQGMRQLALADDIRRLAAQPRYAPDEARRLHHTLRQLLGTVNNQ
jgi:hypothetical protein